MSDTPGSGAADEVRLLREIRIRRSSRAFDPRPVEGRLLRSVFEAARWAPSSWNEQPWRFLTGTREDPDTFERLAAYLVRGNRWARHAPVLVLSAYKTHSNRSGEPNRVACRDLGAAEQNLVLQAFSLGLIAHQMAGFDHEKAEAELLSSGFRAGSMIAIGYPGDPAALPEKLRAREERPRERKELPELVFGATWGQPAPFLER